MCYGAQNHTTGYNDAQSSATFTVDGSTQRRQKTITTGGATTSGVFDGDMYRQSAPTARTIYYVRDPGGRLLALTDGGTVYYDGLDGHGSVATLTGGGPRLLKGAHMVRLSQVCASCLVGLRRSLASITTRHRKYETATSVNCGSIDSLIRITAMA